MVEYIQVCLCLHMIQKLHLQALRIIWVGESAGGSCTASWTSVSLTTTLTIFRRTATTSSSSGVGSGSSGVGSGASSSVGSGASSVGSGGSLRTTLTAARQPCQPAECPRTLQHRVDRRILVGVDGFSREEIGSPPGTCSPPGVTNVYVRVAFDIVDDISGQTAAGPVVRCAEFPEEGLAVVGLEPGSEGAEDFGAVSALQM